MKHWTEDEDHRLMSWWGAYTVETIAKRLGRTPKGVIDRAKLLGLGAPSRGTWTMQALVAHLGYCDRAIKTAAKRAGVSMDRRAFTTTLGPDGHHARRATRYSLDDDEVDRIIAELQAAPRSRVLASLAGEWGVGRKPAACLDCGTDERPHFARGLCRRCYSRAHYHRTHDAHPVIRRRN
jgi:hypothetical protein